MSEEPTIFQVRYKHKRGFHYIDDDGEPKDVKIDVDLPVEIRIPSQFKVKKRSSKLSGNIILLSPISQEEMTLDWKRALDERLELAEGKLSNSIQDEVEAYIILSSLWPQLAEQIEKKEIDGIVAFRKMHALMYHQERFPDASPLIEREIKSLDPLIETRFHGITITYGNPDLKTTFERFPSDREIMSRLGVKSDYGRKVIVRTFGISMERFKKLWKDADATIEAFEKFKEKELARLERLNASSQLGVGDVILDMIVALKESVEKQKRAQREWQDSQLDKIWKVMFPTAGKRPSQGWDYESRKEVK